MVLDMVSQIEEIGLIGNQDAHALLGCTARCSALLLCCEQLSMYSLLPPGPLLTAIRPCLALRQSVALDTSYSSWILVPGTYCAEVFIVEQGRTTVFYHCCIYDCSVL